MKSLYTDDFYTASQDLSRASASKYASLLYEHYQPNSVVDVGCGRGAWLSAFEEVGASNLVGIDGDWNQQSNIINDRIQYYAQDLNQIIRLDQKFDLAISVEVAEHLLPESGFGFVESLTGLADVVVFGAAFVKQGGVGHINEIRHSEWADFFSSWGFEPFDIFRSRVWEDDTVAWWYQQNTFLYVNTQHELYQRLIQKNIMPISNKKFMNCVHPYLYAQKLNLINDKQTR